MQITRLLAFVGLVATSLGAIVPDVLDERGVAAQRSSDKRSAGDGKKDAICGEIQARAESPEWNTTDIDNRRMMCKVTNHVFKGRREWEITLPNIRIFDSIPTSLTKVPIPSPHHDGDCGHRLHDVVGTGVGWRRKSCSINEFGTASMTYHSFILKKSTVDVAIKRATCGAFNDDFPVCFKA